MTLKIPVMLGLNKITALLMKIRNKEKITKNNQFFVMGGGSHSDRFY